MPAFDEEKFDVHLDELRKKEEEALMLALSHKYGQQYINLQGVTVDTDALRMLSEDESREAEMVIFMKLGNKLSVALRNSEKPSAKKLLEDLKEREYRITLFVCSRASLEYAWLRYADIHKAVASERGVLAIGTERVAAIKDTTKSVADVAGNIAKVSSASRAHQISEVLEVILGSAIALRASDVHIEPEDLMVRLRFRLDGVLLDILDLKHDLYHLLCSRLKLLSGLKLNKVSEAQDGRFTIELEGRQLDIRSSIIPGAFGESIVMRLLDPSTASKTIDDLGINPILRKVIEDEVKRPNGMIITTGPTGSGKTTALYALLRYIHTPEVKIITLEDPIEYKIEGIVQTQVSHDYGFETGLRAILRQDPDVILVGEIRDREVAETALHAALTGHLVLSTLHTNSAAGAIPRLIDLGIDAAMIGSATNLILGQRLIRVLCPECKKKRLPTPTERALLEHIMRTAPTKIEINDETTIADAVGCPACNTTGYRGRIGVFEGIRIDHAMSDAILEDSREESIKEVARAQSIPTIQEDGIAKVLKGITSLQELARVVDIHDAP